MVRGGHGSRKNVSSIVILDCHVHAAALLPGDGHLSARARRGYAFRWMRHQLGVPGTADDRSTQQILERALLTAIEGASELDGAVLLAFDGVYTRDGAPDSPATHLNVSNAYVSWLARGGAQGAGTTKHPRMHFGASIHPYRRDAVAELERCVKMGAVLCKWLPITQRIDPADPLCYPFYEALVHYRVPLLSHTGWEHVLPRLDPRVAAPSRLIPALERGVTVIAAHCGTGSVPGEGSYLDQFKRMAHDYEHLYGDTAGMNLPPRWGSFDSLLADDVVRGKLIHGSDWPVPAYPKPWRHGWRELRAFLREPNQIRRDIAIKKALGLDDAYWHRGARVLGLTSVGSILSS
jgi:hypothetical protein